LSIILFSKNKVLEPASVPVLGQSAECSGIWPLAFHHDGMDSIPGQSM